VLLLCCGLLTRYEFEAREEHGNSTDEGITDVRWSWTCHFWRRSPRKQRCCKPAACSQQSGWDKLLPRMRLMTVTTMPSYKIVDMSSDSGTTQCGEDDAWTQCQERVSYVFLQKPKTRASASLSSLLRLRFRLWPEVGDKVIGCWRRDSYVRLTVELELLAWRTWWSPFISDARGVRV
jgi:hypothetical protein